MSVADEMAAAIMRGDSVMYRWNLRIDDGKIRAQPYREKGSYMVENVFRNMWPLPPKRIEAWSPLHLQLGEIRRDLRRIWWQDDDLDIVLSQLINRVDDLAALVGELMEAAK